MIKINMFSSADKVSGQGVGSAYKELIQLLKNNLADKFEVTINKNTKSDITHYHTIDPLFYLSTFFKKKRGRTIGYVHFLPETLEGSIKLPRIAKAVFYKYVISFYKRMDHIVVVNPIFIPKLEKYGIKKEDVTYIPNFVSTDTFFEKSVQEKIDFRDKIGIKQEDFVIFGDGQVQERKGIDDFFKLAKNNPDIKFIWAGGFSFGKITDGYDRYKKMIDNPPQNLIFTGIVSREELVNYYNICDVFLLPSYDELFPMSVLEALSCGAPVLLRDLELYTAILDGYYESGKDYDELNAKINFMKENPELLRSLKLKSKEASQKYSEANLTKIWQKFYLEQAQQGD